MDIKAKIEELVAKIKGDEKLQRGFAKEPVKTVEGLLGVKLPEDQIKPLIDGIKAKLNLDNVGDIAGKLGGLFGKK
jgi:hypothetical protein